MLGCSKQQMKAAENVPQFNIGDTVRVHFRIVEGDKERVQVHILHQGN